MKKILNYIFFSFLIYLSIIVILELIFGDWLKSNNFGYAVREHRNVNIPMSVEYEGKKYDYVFKRNNYGFIGEEINPQNTEIVFLGGSTGEEMFKPYNYSIVGRLNEKLKDDKFEFEIINASTGGKSTRGYVNDFNFWFSKIENFDPKIYIFYIGLNDASLSLPGHFDEPIKKNNIEKIEDYIKNNSIFYQVKKKIENKYFNELRTYYGLKKKDLYNNFNFINYESAVTKFYKTELDNKKKTILENFSQNLNNLKNIIQTKNIHPIFITQIKFDGLNDHSLFLVNEYLKKFCEKNKFDIIRLDEMKYILDSKDFYDQFHTTLKGSEKISSLIYPQLIKYLTN